MLRAQDVIRLLNLQPHPIEGGHLRETHRSDLTLPGTALPAHRAERAACTAIPLRSPEDAGVSIVAGPPGLNWKENDLVWEVPADFPGGPVPVVVVAQTAANRSVAFGFLIEVQE